MAIHRKATFKVCISNPTIIAVQIIAPSVHTTGTIGVLNGRSISGDLTRKIHTPILTSTKANSVPKLVKSPAT